MNTEIEALESNKTWEITDLPRGKKAIGSKWVYKVKLKSDGTVDRYKARLVAKGYNQKAGVDYFDSFSPVAKNVTVRLFLAIAARKGWPVEQLDVNNAFLHGYLKDEVYMKAPDGYAVPANKVCKLIRSLYGLKQAGREWNSELIAHLSSIGFIQSQHDYCLFVRSVGDDFLAILVYVDDLLIMGLNMSLISEVKGSLHRAFTIKDIGLVKYYLGLEIARSAEGMIISQKNTLQIY